jgi:hypothetical protein
MSLGISGLSAQIITNATAMATRCGFNISNASYDKCSEGNTFINGLTLIVRESICKLTKMRLSQNEEFAYAYFLAEKIWAIVKYDLSTLARPTTFS